MADKMATKQEDKMEIKMPDEGIGDCDWRLEEHTLFGPMKFESPIHAIAINWFRRAESKEKTWERCENGSTSACSCVRARWTSMSNFRSLAFFSRIRNEFPFYFSISRERVSSVLWMLNDCQVGDAIFYEWPSSVRLDHNQLRMPYIFSHSHCPSDSG